MSTEPPAAPPDGTDRPPHDLRPPLLAAAAWGGGLLAYLVGPPGIVVLGLLAGAALLGLHRHDRGPRAPARRRWLVALVIVAVAVGGTTLLRHRATAHDPVRALAADRATVDLVAQVVSDPRIITGPFGDQAIVRLKARRISGRGAQFTTGATVLVLGDPAWTEVALGATVHTEGRLDVPDDPDLSALLTGADPPTTLQRPDLWWRGAGAVRASIRAAVAHRPEAQRSLVPALVDGDDAGLPPEVEQDFRTTGLTHLTAVSGTNLTLLLGFVVLLARSVGVRGRWLHVVGVVGVVGFILLARTEPSVLRAAGMGVVGLFALGTDGRRRGLRALGVAVVALLLISPALAVSPGFALSTLATAGIVLFVPGFTTALRRWLPTPLAAAIAVPLAAQLACTPIVAALSGEVSLVAVLANLLAEPAVGPATVLGLAAGLIGLVWPWGGTVLGTLAGLCVGWIVTVAEHGAALPGAAAGWGSGPWAIAVLAALCLAALLGGPAVLARPRLGIPLVVGSLLVVLGIPGRLPWPGTDGWPGDGWALVACDVGQGDGLVIATGPGSTIVVDTGPDPDPMKRCLDDLGIRDVPLVLLTHFHADHIDGLGGVFAGRTVGAVETTAVLDPPEGAEQVVDESRDAGVPVGLAPVGTTRTVGAVRLQLLAPALPGPVPGAGDGTSANNASLVALVEVAGLRILLTGDVEPPGQADLARLVPELDVDVLKVPHHGSRYQDQGWLLSLRPEVAIVQVGADNDYGHPADATLDPLRQAGAVIARTDTDGAVAVLPGPSGPTVVTRR